MHFLDFLNLYHPHVPVYPQKCSFKVLFDCRFQVMSSVPREGVHSHLISLIKIMGLQFGCSIGW